MFDDLKPTFTVMPAKAGIQYSAAVAGQSQRSGNWVPAFAGTTPNLRQ